MNFDTEQFIKSLDIMGKGMLGIFIVTLAIILTIVILNITTSASSRNAIKSIFTKKKK